MVANSPNSIGSDTDVKRTIANGSDLAESELINPWLAHRSAANEDASFLLYGNDDQFYHGWHQIDDFVSSYDSDCEDIILLSEKLGDSDSACNLNPGFRELDGDVVTLNSWVQDAVDFVDLAKEVQGGSPISFDDEVKRCHMPLLEAVSPRSSPGEASSPSRGGKWKIKSTTTRAQKTDELLREGLQMMKDELDGAHDALVDAANYAHEDIEDAAAMLVANPLSGSIALNWTVYEVMKNPHKLVGLERLPGGRFFFSGQVEFSEDVKCHYNQELPIYRSGSVLNSARDGLLILVDGLQPATPEQPCRYAVTDPFSYLELHPGNEEKIREIALGQLGTLDYARQGSVYSLIKKIVTRYKQYNRSYPRLEYDVSRVVQSQWFHDLCDQNNSADKQARYRRLRVQAERLAAQNGDDIMWMVAWYRLRNTTRALLLACVTIMSHHAAIYNSDMLMGMFAVVTGATLAPVCLAIIHLALIYSHCSVARKVYRHAIGEGPYRTYLQGAGSSFKIFPMDMAWIKKSVVDRSRLVEPLAPDVDIRTHYEFVEPEDAPEEMISCGGTIIPDTAMFYPQNTNQNVHSAILVRMAQTLKTNPREHRKFLEHAKQFVDTLELTLPEVGTREEVYAHLCSQYSVRRADYYMSYYDEPIVDKDLVATLFCKAEPYLCKDESNVKCRMIWARKPILIAKYSLFFHRLSKQMSKLFSKDTNLYYTSGARPIDLGDYAKRMYEDYCHVFESDVSNWDGSMSREMLSIGKYLMTEKLGVDREYFAPLLDNWFNMSGRTRDGSVRVKMGHGRRSGDLWTSCFNSLINIALVTYCYDLKPYDNFAVMVMGDDNVVAFDKLISVADVQENYTKLDLKCEVVNRENIDDLTYCSGRFWDLGNGMYKWGNLPFKVFSKLGMNHGKHPLGNLKRLLNGTCLGMLCSAGHVPILGSFLRALADTAEAEGIRPLRDRRHDNPYRPMGGVPCYPTVETYQQFERVYGVSVDEQLALEEWIEDHVSINDAPYRLDDPIFTEGIETEFKPTEFNDWFREQVDDRTVAMKEEAIKLHGVTSSLGAWESGWSFGLEEDKILGTVSHRFLHALFSLISFHFPSIGVSLHEEYNRVAMFYGGYECNKKKARRRRRKTKHTVSSILKMLGKEALIGGGGILGGMAFGAPGSQVGRKAGAYISKITGMGDYKVSSNTLLSNGPPQFGGSARKVRICHREFLGTVDGSIEFNLNTYKINPGEPSTFPWLSGLASRFTQYTLKGLIFEYVSTSAVALNSTNTALGSVVMATQYNSYDAAFTSRLEMDNHEFTTSCPPSEHSIHPVECDVSETPFRVHYVRNYAQTGNADERLYDWGKFSIATVGMQAAATIGELWVSYDIEFEKPRLEQGAYTNALHARISNTAATADDPFGVVQRNPGGNMDLTISSTYQGYDTIVFPQWIQSGRYYIDVRWNGSVTSFSHTTTAFTNCALATDGWGYQIDTDWDGYGTAENALIVDITGPGATIAMDYSAGASDFVDIYVFQGPGSGNFQIPSTSVSLDFKFEDLYDLVRRYHNDEETKEDGMLLRRLA
jgi:hypothetical protein